jgi:hypothetical protein
MLRAVGLNNAQRAGSALGERVPTTWLFLEHLRFGLTEQYAVRTAALISRVNEYPPRCVARLPDVCHGPCC